MPYSWRCSPSLESGVHATDEVNLADNANLASLFQSMDALHLSSGTSWLAMDFYGLP